MISVFMRDFHYKFTDNRKGAVLTNMLNGNTVILSLYETMQCNRSNVSIQVAIDKHLKYLLSEVS